MADEVLIQLLQEIKQHLANIDESLSTLADNFEYAHWDKVREGEQKSGDMESTGP